MKIGLKASVARVAFAVGGMALAGSAGATPSSTKPAPKANTPQICVERGPSNVFTSQGNFMLWNWDRQDCQGNTYGVSLPTGTGSQGPAGPKGETGAAGAQGPSGVQSLATSQINPINGGGVNTGGGVPSAATNEGTRAVKCG